MKKKELKTVKILKEWLEFSKNIIASDFGGGEQLNILRYKTQQAIKKSQIKPANGKLDLETMIDNLPENRILYKDSGSWSIYDEQHFTLEDKPIYQQTSKETFYDFIKRCFDNENEYYITEL